MDGTAFYGSVLCSKAFPSLSVLPTFEFVEWKHVSEFSHYASKLKINHLYIIFNLSGHTEF